ncbi:ABC transporter permease [halophilic archaeon]|nr:ABC transporter permease [halophilic archaeon]
MRRKHFLIAAFAALAVAGALVVEVFFPASPTAAVIGVVDVGYLQASLRVTVPIAFAALGGIFAERSGVINIGLEGLLIISAFTGVAVSGWSSSLASPATAAWLGFLAAVAASTLLALLFAVVTIDLKADQVIAGLAVWLIALGFAPFASRVVWGSTTSSTVPTLSNWVVPGLAAIPVVGPVFFNANPTVYMLLTAVPLSWYVLRNTPFGRWVRASGENPRALDTAGVDVRKVRYASVLLSGVLAGIGGAGLSLSLGQFIGSGATMVDGRGWIGITAYLFGNYNPVGAFGASLLFAALSALEIRLQTLGFSVSQTLIRLVPYVIVIVVLALVGRTRTPDAAGDHYESGEE